MTGVLVTGGTGKTGTALVELLRGNGVPVRVASRNPSAGDPDAVRFDWVTRPPIRSRYAGWTGSSWCPGQGGSCCARPGSCRTS